MKELKEKISIILLVLLIISLWGNYSNYNQLRNLQNDFNRTSSMLENRINDISHNVSNTLNDFKKESMWVRESFCEVIGFTDNLEKATIKVSLTLNEKYKDEKLFIMATSKEDKLRFEIPQSDDLSYNLEIVLSGDRDYDLQLVGENKEAFRSDALDKVNLNGYKNQIIAIDAQLLGGQYDENKKEGYYSFYVAVSQMQKSEEMFAEYLKDLEIEEVKADVYYGDRYVNTIDFLKGTNYIPMDIKNISYSIPEAAAMEHMNERKHFFSGKYEIKGESNLSEILFVIKVRDNKGNTYQQFMGDGRLMEEKLKEYNRGQ